MHKYTHVTCWVHSVSLCMYDFRADHVVFAIRKSHKDTLMWGWLVQRWHLGRPLYPTLGGFTVPHSVTKKRSRTLLFCWPVSTFHSRTNFKNLTIIQAVLPTLARWRLCIYLNKTATSFQIPPCLQALSTHTQINKGSGSFSFFLFFWYPLPRPFLVNFVS